MTVNSLLLFKHIVALVAIGGVACLADLTDRAKDAGLDMVDGIRELTEGGVIEVDHQQHVHYAGL